MAGYTTGDSSDTAPDYQCEGDAECLKKHQEITADPDRHKKALDHLQDQKVMHGKAIAEGRRKLHGKVKKGLQKAFPSANAKTPFEQAAGGSED
jgi:hypothetical protein